MIKISSSNNSNNNSTTNNKNNNIKMPKAEGYDCG